jgi:excisionase family DNA binding protein
MGKLLSTEEAASILNVHSVTLNNWRCQRRYDLPYVKVGRMVRYREDDVTAFIERHLQDHGELA